MFINQTKESKDIVECKEILSIIALSLMILLIPITTFAESDSSRPPMTIEWSLAEYPKGTSISITDGIAIKITGIINAGYDSTFQIGDDPLFPVSITILNPAQDVVFVDQVHPGCAYDQCYFESDFRTGGIGYDYTGLYTITAQYKKQTATTDFPFITTPKQTKSSEGIVIITPISVDWRFENNKLQQHSTITGDSIVIYGKINSGQSTFESGEKINSIAIRVSNPEGQTAFVDQIRPVCNYDYCTFETKVTLDGPYFQEPGQYTANACHTKPTGTTNTACAETSFDYIVKTTSTNSDFKKQKDTTYGRILELQDENNSLRQEISGLKSQITQLESKINNLNEIIMEQVQVIYDWVVSK